MPGPRFSASLSYEPAVDGLRAVSIASVVAFHLGIPGMSGGFVGVDVFFVISGYLIIGQIVDGLRAGRFSFAEFWARRILRILPPLYLVIVCATVVAAFVLVRRDEIAEFRLEVRDSVLMTVNFHFFSLQGYFDVAADRKPLLHLWTLAVEEQFYLAAPILIWGLWHLAKRMRAHGAAVWWVAGGGTFLASLVGCVAFSSHSPNPAYYLTPFRAWEFILGGALPLLSGLLSATRRTVPAALAIVGLGAILGAAVLFDDATPFPSWRVALPVVGAGLVIAATNASPSNLVSRFLATKPMVALGLVSYSWYLWHWPALAFVRIANFGERDFALDLAAAAASLGLSVATYLLVERPVRRWRKELPRGGTSWTVIAGGLSVAAAITLVVVNLDLTPSRVRAVQAIYERPLPSSPVQNPCHVENHSRPRPACEQLVARGKRVGFLAGDSHALVFSQELFDRATELDTALLSVTLPGCKPLLVADTALVANRAVDCRDLMAAGIDDAAHFLSNRPSFAILFARWNSGTSLRRDKDAGLRASLRSNLGIADRPPPGARASLVAALAETIGKLRELGVERVLLVAPVPEFRLHAEECVLRAAVYGISPEEKCGRRRAAVERRRGRTVAAMQFVADHLPEVRLADGLAAFCDQSECRPYRGTEILYRDMDHLNRAGAAWLYDQLSADFRWVFGLGPAATPVSGKH